MDKKTKQIYSWFVAVIVVIVLVAVLKFKQTGNNKNEQLPDKPSGQTASQQTTGNVKSKSDVWVGILKASDNLNKGSLILSTTERNIYIKTNRNYSALIGKKVRVSYEGSWQNFVLGDITLAEQE